MLAEITCPRCGGEVSVEGPGTGRCVKCGRSVLLGDTMRSGQGTDEVASLLAGAMSDWRAGYPRDASERIAAAAALAVDNRPAIMRAALFATPLDHLSGKLGPDEVDFLLSVVAEMPECSLNLKGAVFGLMADALMVIRRVWRARDLLSRDASGEPVVVEIDEDEMETGWCDRLGTLADKFRVALEQLPTAIDTVAGRNRHLVMYLAGAESDLNSALNLLEEVTGDCVEEHRVMIDSTIPFIGKPAHSLDGEKDEMKLGAGAIEYTLKNGKHVFGVSGKENLVIYLAHTPEADPGSMKFSADSEVVVTSYPLKTRPNWQVSIKLAEKEE